MLEREYSRRTRSKLWLLMSWQYYCQDNSNHSCGIDRSFFPQAKDFNYLCHIRNDWNSKYIFYVSWNNFCTARVNRLVKLKVVYHNIPGWSVIGEESCFAAMCFFVLLMLYDTCVSLLANGSTDFLMKAVLPLAKKLVPVSCFSGPNVIGEVSKFFCMIPHISGNRFPSFDEIL